MFTNTTDPHPETGTSESSSSAALTLNFNFTTIPLLYAALTQMVLPEKQARCQKTRTNYEQHIRLRFPRTNLAGELISNDPSFITCYISK